MIKSLLRISCRTIPAFAYVRTPIVNQMQFQFAKSSRKQKEKAQLKKQKDQIKESLGGDISQVDLNKYDEGYIKVINQLKEQLSTIKAGRLQVAAVLKAPVKLGSQNFTVAELGQVSAKGANTCVLSPYDSSELEAIQKSLRFWDDSLQIKKVQKTLVLTQAAQGKQARDKLLQKSKKIVNDRRESLKQLRSKTQDELKKYKKLIPQNRLRTIQTQAKALFDKKNQQIDKIEKEKEKELSK